MPIFPSVITALLEVDPIGTYGCAFDHRVTFDGATTGSTGIITSATIAFTNADINKRVVLSGAGASGAQYVGTITSLNSATSANVTPNTTTTVSAKGLQVHTDDLASWTALISDVNNSPYPGAHISIRSAGVGGTFTNRSGISSFLPPINKQVRFDGIAGAHNADTGDYTKMGGSCIAYVGTSSAPTAFGAVMTIAPLAGATNQNLKQVTVSHMWIDCRNGDQNEALKGLSLQSCFGWALDDFFVMDPLALGIEFLVISPGTAGALGEAKDCSRGVAKNVGVRCLDAVSSPGPITTTPTTTTTAVTLTTTGQSLALAAAITNSPAAGYAWIQTNLGYPVLVNYTGGGGTTTLTGCTVSAQDAVNAPATVSGSNVVSCQPPNACSYLLDGDLTANANLNHFDTCVVSQGTTWGPAGVEFRNSDSNEFTNVIINGGSAVALAQPNRITRPGVRFNGSNTNVTLAARNNVFKSGSAGVGGVCQMGILNTNANMSAQSGPQYWDNYQLGNGEPIPVVEGNSFFEWGANGGLGQGVSKSPASVAAQTAIANAVTLITGSILAVPPQGFQIGTILQWTIMGVCTTTATATNIVVRLGTTGTTADAAVATFAPTSVAATATLFRITIVFIVRTLGGTATAYAFATCACPTAGNIFGAGSNVPVEATMASFNSGAAQQFFSVSCLTGAAGSTVTPHLCFVEVIKPANP